MSPERLFSLDEANAELEGLRELLPRIREARRGLIAASERIEEAVATDGGGVSAPEWFAHQQALKDGVEELARRGILLRDPDLGIVDFPAERDGVRVFLCWRLGETAVAHFHGELGGYSRRRPL